INPIFDSIHVSFNSKFKLTSKQPVNTTINKPINSAFNLPLATLVTLKLSPFKIESVVSKNTFKLSRPLKWKAIHPVFHVSLLEPAKGIYLGKTHPPPEPVNVQDHLEWEVSRILYTRLRKGKLQYLVKWAGHQSDKDQTSWEPTNHLLNSPDLVQDFHSAYPHKPRQP
ncbi:uncharacterized protein VP01_2690g1, partial [Puccinia sorghi]